jgi:hypothetical protein
MRSVARLLLIVAIFVGGVAMGARHRGGGIAVAQQRPVIRVTGFIRGPMGSRMRRRWRRDLAWLTSWDYSSRRR